MNSHFNYSKNFKHFFFFYFISVPYQTMFNQFATAMPAITRKTPLRLFVPRNADTNRTGGVFPWLFFSRTQHHFWTRRQQFVHIPSTAGVQRQRTHSHVHAVRPSAQLKSVHRQGNEPEQMFRYVNTRFKSF